jgi:predicted ATPase
MIERLNIRNFKCLRDVTVDFAPLTVLIGLNDSGKTSILEAIHVLGRMASEKVPEVFSGAFAPEGLTWKHDPSARMDWQLQGKHAAKDFTFCFAITRGAEVVLDDFSTWQGLRASKEASSSKIMLSGAGPTELLTPRPIDYSAVAVAVQSGREVFKQAASAFVSHGRLRLDPDALRKRTVTQPGLTLSPSGDNLAAVLDALLTGPDRKSVTDMEAALGTAIPTLQGVSTPSAPGGKPGEKTIEFVLAGDARPPVTIPCELASDGAMLMTAYLTLAYSETPDVLLVEEPENGLHPGMLASVIQLLRDMTTGKVGVRPRQVILTTHSPLLLNYAKPEEIRIVRRDEAGTNVTPMSAVAGLNELLVEFGVGELWFLVGEQGLVEGRKP